MRNQPRVSVIIPIYNGEDHLPQLFAKLEEQTAFGQLEIILVDDGSKDRTAILCEEFSCAHKNVLVYKQENQGVSAARNAGLNLAKGSYITFCDCDDLPNHQLYERLIEGVQKTNKDISVVNYSFVNGKKKVLKEPKIKKGLDREESLKAFFQGRYIDNSLFNKLIKREILNNLAFNSSYKIGEDMLFIYQVLKKTNGAYVDTRESLYDYLQHDNSAMHSDFGKKFEDPIEISRYMVQDLRHTMPLLEEWGMIKYLHELMKYLRVLLSSNSSSKNKEEANRVIKEIKVNLTLPIFKKMSYKQKISLSFVLVHPKLYVWITNRIY